MSDNQEYRNKQGHDRDKSVQEDINEKVLAGEENSKESTGEAENNQGNWLGNFGKVDTSAQGSVMPEYNNTIDESDKPETKVPPSLIDTDGKTGTRQNDTDPSNVYHGIPVTTHPNSAKNLKANTEEAGKEVHVENTDGTSEEG